MKNFFTLLFILALGCVTYGQGGTDGTGGDKKKTTNKKTKTTDGGTEDKKDATAGWKSFSSSSTSIKYPTNWSLDENSMAGVSFFLYSPLESNDDNFKENINLMIQDFKDYDAEGTTLEEFVQITLAQVETVLSNGELISSATKSKDGKTYQEIVYKGTQNYYNLTWKQHLYVENDKAYILTFTSVQEKYNAYIATADLILESFKF